MKKFAAYLLSVAVVFVCLCFVGCGEKQYTDGQGIVYTLSDNKYTVTSVTNRDVTNIEIPDAIDGKPVVAIAPAAFSECEKLKTVNFSDCIVEIGDRAFV